MGELQPDYTLVRRQVFKHGVRVGSISPGPVATALIADWPPEKLAEAKASGSLLGSCLMFEASYTSELIELGLRDTLTRRDELLDFLH